MEQPLLFPAHEQEHNTAGQGSDPKDRWQRHGMFLFHIGIDFQWPKVDDALLFVRREIELSP